MSSTKRRSAIHCRAEHTRFPFNSIITNMRHKFLALLFLSVGLAACESTTSVMTVLDTTVVNSSDRVLLVASEGAYGSGNGTLDAVIFHTNPATDTAIH